LEIISSLTFRRKENGSYKKGVYRILIRGYFPHFDFSKPIPKSKWSKLKKTLLKKERFRLKVNKETMKSRH